MKPRRSHPATDYKRKSQIVLGMAVICGVFILETVLADSRMPNPLSPLVWAVLGTGAGVSLLAHVWYRRQARRTAK